MSLPVKGVERVEKRDECQEMHNKRSLDLISVLVTIEWRSRDVLKYLQTN